MTVKRSRTYEELIGYSIPIPETGCYIWFERSLNKHGYGKIWHEGKMWGAHKLAYELSRGKVQKGLQLDHLCRIRCCINPAHLEPVTPRENVLRGLAPLISRMRRITITHCKYGHHFDENNTYYLPDGHRECRECGKLKMRKRRMDKKIADGTAA